MKISVTYYNPLDKLNALLGNYDGELVRVGDELYVLEVLNGN